MKKLAVVAGGWHFPITFYEQIATQKIPDGWQVDLFCVSHRDPEYAVEEKKRDLAKKGYSRRELFDRLMYAKIPTIKEIEALGFNYSLEPNTMADWGITNQWLEKHDYKVYDKFLFTHDDNFILTDTMFVDILPQEDWLILSNSSGHAQRRLRQWLHLPKIFFARGSFEFFTREAMDAFGGRFDLYKTTLTREGKFDTPKDFAEISEWNDSDRAVREVMVKKGLLPHVKSLSPYYRMSVYCLEGERGYISHTESSNRKEEERGLDAIEKFYATRKTR